MRSTYQIKFLQSLLGLGLVTLNSGCGRGVNLPRPVSGVNLVNGKDPCHFNRVDNVYSFVLNTSEPGGGSGADGLKETTEQAWTVDASMLRMKVQTNTGFARAVSQRIIHAECNPNSGKTVVVTRLAPYDSSDILPEDRQIGIFLVHARWRTIEVLTLPLKNNARQGYLPWVNGKQTKPENWSPTEKGLAQFIKNNPEIPKYGLENTYQGKSKYPFHKGSKENQLVGVDTFNWAQLKNEHAGWAEIEFPPGVADIIPETGVESKLKPRCPREHKAKGDLFYIQPDSSVGYSGGYVVRQCADKNRSESIFTQVLEFVKCKSVWDSNTKETGEYNSSTKLCGGLHLLD